MIYKDRYAHGIGVISENTTYRSVLVSVSVVKFSFVLGIESIRKSGIGTPLSMISHAQYITQYCPHLVMHQLII